MRLELPADDSFYRKILDLEGHLASLQQAPRTARGQLLDAALEDLKLSLEELHVAHEELQAQNQELESARYTLEAERQRYQELFDLAPDGYLLTSIEGVVQEANQALSNLLGLSPRFLLGEPLLAFIAPEDQREFSFQLHRLGQHQQASEFEARLQPQEGIAFSVRFTVNPVRDPQGKLTGLRWLAHDSTQRNRLEARRIRQRLAELSRISQSITTTLELPVVLQEIITGACQLIGARYGAVGVFNSSEGVEQLITYGLSQDEQDRIGDLPRAKGLLGWLHQQQQPVRLADLSQHALSVGFPPHHPPMKTFLGVPARFNHAVLGSLYLTGKEGGQEFTQDDEDLLVLFAAQAALAINNAMTYQRERTARAQLEEERQRLATLVGTSPVGIFVADISGQVTLLNREAERILGCAHQPDYRLEKYQEAAVYRRPDGSAYSPQDLPLQRALYSGESVLGEEVRIEFPDGRAVLTAVSSRPLYGPNGGITGAIAVFQDISVLEESERQRTEFLGMVSHELRTPITAIKGAAATVLSNQWGVDPQEALEFFGIINEQADHLTGLVNNLLDLTRIESGTLSVNPEPADLREVLQEVVASFARAGNTQEVRLQLPDQPPASVQADRRRIGQVVTNLLNNAARSSPAFSTILIRVENGPTHATIQVQDSGRGIPPEALPHLFRKFSQVYGASDRNNGTGLGLAICKGIVEAHGGRIWADSPGPGQGATFSFTLPLAAENSGLPTPVVYQGTGSRGSVSRPIQRTRILAVDDDPHVLRYLRRLLDDAEYDIKTTDNPEEVFSLVELDRPDLVILDLMLPGTSGLELLRQVRRISSAPVIFLTAQDADETVVSALREGADDYITKPFSPSELLARIDTVLRRRSDSGERPTLPPFVLNGRSGEPGQALIVDFSQRRVTVGEEVVTLTATEYRLLYHLASNSGRTLTHDQILQRVWGDEYSGETELVRSMIRNLRAKLGDDGRHPRFIFTEPGVGYRMPRP
jgi:PAS domain S-box-containing protein